MINVLAWLVFFGALGVAYFAERYRGQRDSLRVQVSEFEVWIDEIIEALENQNEEEGDGKIDSLVSQVNNA